MKILVTETQPEALDALVMTLEAYQHVTTRARGEREALEVLAHTPAASWPDVWVIGRGFDAPAAESLQAAARSRFGTIPPCLALTAETQALGMDHLERAITRAARWH
jgi:DNA-binding response OmpR family regulator